MSPKFFNPWREIDRTHNHLPHWQQEGASYFVTWRLADSLPKERLDKHYHEREQWIRLHPEPWDEQIEAEYHRRFSTRMDAWLDEGHGGCLLRDPRHAKVVFDTLLHFDGTRAALISFVVMPNHVHVLFTLNPEWKLEEMIHTWKRHSAHEINRHRGDTGPLWMKDYFDRLIRDPAHLNNCVRYIRKNPTKARLRVGEYLLYESPVAQSIL
ncbi:transposase [Prosthecobacter sp.]|jgi:putative transposase|uniref:transposase n=1 Tax=Prosthecobacter sp. TaxID=1965333 RepID=UPI0025D67A12|nr:transposase [Prosthecobacter sp.]